MKRFQVLLIILLSGLLLLAASYFWPKDDVKFGKHVIKFIPKNEILRFKVQESSQNVDSIIAALESRAYGINENNIKRMSILDESIFSSSLFLENPETGNGETALSNFFKALQKTDSSLIRIGHYGDSQIEGDRITSIIRIMFQDKFGGNGVGYVPIDDITDPVSYTRSCSPNWTRYTVFHNKSSKGLYNNGGCVFRYRFVVPESTRDSIADNGDTIKIKVPAASYSNATLFLKLFRGYSNMSIWYGNGTESSNLKVYNSRNNELLADVSLDSEDSFNVLKIPLTQNATTIKCVFTGPSPEIYGFSFDPLKGVQLDNYGLRGHGGEGILNISSSFLNVQFVKLNNQLAILQFGGNVTPYVKNESSLNGVKQSYNRLYAHFRKAMPSGSVLAIGVNDVARSVGGTYVSYPMVGRIRDVQKEVALQNGCAFFDLYKLMGGENSVLSWHKKGWASRDGHFSDRGREIVVNELFLAIMSEYNKFLIHGTNLKNGK